MSKLLTPENLAKDEFERRKKHFLVDMDALGKKYDIQVMPVLEAQKATDSKTQDPYLVYVPKFNIIDRKSLNSEAPKKTQDAKKEG